MIIYLIFFRLFGQIFQISCIISVKSDRLIKIDHTRDINMGNDIMLRTVLKNIAAAATLTSKS